MMRARFFTHLLVGLSVLFGACADTTDREGQEATTTEAQGTITEGEEPVAERQIEDFYLREFLAVDDGEKAVELLSAERFDVEKVLAHEVLGIDADEATEVIDTYLQFVLVRNADPLEAAQILGEDNPASPVFAMGLAGHWSFAPGTPPAPVTDYKLIDVGDATLDSYVAVIDSGIDDSALPGWMAEDNVVFDSQDVESPPDASHGTFVASVIRQLAPEYRVSIARAETLSPDAFTNSDEIPFAVPSELNVAYAIERIKQRGHAEIAALNLSLGAYITDPQQDRWLLTLTRALGRWSEDYPKAPIFAAAGNEQHSPWIPFWPAMMEIVTGVQATDGSMGVVWDTSHNPVPGPSTSEPWVDEQAPGVDIIGLRGGGSPEEPLLVSWSGSSFATAVATGLTVGGKQPVIDHASVPGLSYLDAAGNRVTNHP